MKRFSAPVLSALAGLLLASCYKVPVTGRRALNIVDEKQVTTMSIAMFNDMKKQYRPSHDRDRLAQLKRVGDRLQGAVSIWDMPDADWEFVLFDVPNQINAFAMAGGKVGVFSGLFKIIQNDDQLASVLAHEIAHVTAKHVHEKLSRELRNEVVGTGLMLGTGGVGYLTQGVLAAAYGFSTGVGGLAFDRKMEKEADYIGLMYMARAGYNPEEAIKVLEQLEAESGTAAGSSFFSTHPSEPERIVRLMDSLPEARKEQAQSQAKAAPILIK